MATSSIPALDAKVPMVDLTNGRPSPQFQRMWQNIRLVAETGGQAGVDISGKVDKLGSTGWDVTTGASTKIGYSVYISPSISATYNQSQMQIMSDAVQAIDRRLKALVDGLIAADVLGG